MLKMKMLAAVSATAMAVFAIPAVAQVAVYTDQALFDSQRPGITTNTFPFSTAVTQLNPPTYTQAGVTFSSSLLFALNDGGYGSTPYLDARTDPLTISFNGPVLGLTLGAFQGAETINYVVNGQAGSLALGANRATSFIGFDTGRANSSINVTFTFGSEVDVLNFQTAVPEAATWAMMMVGLGVVGGSLRRRRSVTTRVQFA